MSYAIEIHRWFPADDPSLLGTGCSESDNIWRTEQEALDAWQTRQEALDAIETLVTAGFDRLRLRVVKIDGYELSD